MRSMGATCGVGCKLQGQWESHEAAGGGTGCCVGATWGGSNSRVLWEATGKQEGRERKVSQVDGSWEH